MQITTEATITGCKPVNFEEHQWVNLYVLVAVKGGTGEKTAKFKLPDLSRSEEVKTMVGKKCSITGELEENDSGQTFFVVSDIKALSRQAA